MNWSNASLNFKVALRYYFALRLRETAKAVGEELTAEEAVRAVGDELYIVADGDDMRLWTENPKLGPIVAMEAGKAIEFATDYAKGMSRTGGRNG